MNKGDDPGAKRFNLIANQNELYAQFWFYCKFKNLLYVQFLFFCPNNEENSVLKSFASGKFARAGGNTKVTHFTSYTNSTASTQRATGVSRELSLIFPT